MPTYEVEVECTYREVVLVDADSEDEAREQYRDWGNVIVSEHLSDQGVVSVRLEDE